MTIPNLIDAPLAPDDAWDLLSPSISPARREKMEKVAGLRTPYIRLALQDVHDPHNVGACMRSAEAFGLLNVDLINVYQKFGKPSSVARGARHWLDIHKFNDITTYVRQLKDRGFKIAAAYPATCEWAVDRLPLDSPLVIVFGNEHAGLHDSWHDLVDHRFTIPMYGMVESFNISVSVALTLFSLNQRGRAQLAPEDFLLSAQHKQQLLNRWACLHSHDAEKELTRLRQLQKP